MHCALVAPSSPSYRARMSTAKYSGIAVAAANRAALARQEADAEREASVRRVDAKSEALLAHLRSTMTAAALLGAQTREADAREGGRAQSAGSGNADASGSGRRAANDQRASTHVKEKTESTSEKTVEKRHMSKAERKKLKRAREDVAKRDAATPARDVRETHRDEAHDTEARRKKKKKKASSERVLGPLGRV